MLQEFLTALNGITGNIFVEDNNGIIKILHELPFVVPSEQSLMNEVCILGTYYRRMQKFINLFSNPLIDKEISGLYKISLAYGVSIALEEYRNILILIQKELLTDPFLSVSYIRAKLNDYFILFPTLWKILDSVKETDRRGCQILDAVFNNIPIGNYKIRAILNQILKRCNCTLYRQISAWILQGALFDPYNEFFITAVLDEKVEEQIKTNDETQPILIDNMNKSEIALLAFSNERLRVEAFKINEKNIPCFIPISLVKKILFIGESVHFFDKNRKRILIKDWTDSTDENKLKSELSEKFSRQLNNLKEIEGFNLLKMQEVVENVEKYILSRMWSLLVEENGFLDDYFSEIKDYLLLGRGELFIVFITNMEKNMINCSKNNSTEASMNSEFLKAARTVFLDDEKSLNKFRFVLNKNSTEINLKWEDIQLTYDVRWPFHIVFTPEIMKIYNDLFQFLIMVKRTQMRLNGLFSINSIRGLSHTIQWQLKNHMSFFINHLQYYIQVDVIESQMSLFKKKVLENRDIEVLKSTHENLVNTLKAHSFLFNSVIRRGLLDISHVCIEYCDLIELNSRLESNQIANITSKLVMLQNRFHSLSTTLYNIFTNVEGNVSSNPHLRQLLVQLDYNSFFSALGSQIGSMKKNTHVKKYTV